MECPPGNGGKFFQARVLSVSTPLYIRYYEVEILSPGSCAVGWALTDAGPDVTLGGDDTSWAYDGSRLRLTFNKNCVNVTISYCSEEKIFGGLRETYGKKWAVGDIIGVFLDTNDKTIGE